MKQITSLLLSLAVLLCALAALGEGAIGASPERSVTEVIEDLGETSDGNPEPGLGDAYAVQSNFGGEDVVMLEDEDEDEDIPARIKAFVNEADGHFIVQIPLDLMPGGEWVTDGKEGEADAQSPEGEQPDEGEADVQSPEGDQPNEGVISSVIPEGDQPDEDGAFRLASEQTQDGVYIADFEPVADGETVIQLYHYTGPACDAMLGFVLSIVDGRAQEPEYSYWTDTSDAADWDEFVCGDWVMADNEENTMAIAKRADNGWDVQIIATLDGETDGFTMSMYYDCDQELFAYDDGAIHHVAQGVSGSGEMEEAFANGIPGTFMIVPDETGDITLIWTFDAMPGEQFSFVHVQGE